MISELIDFYNNLREDSKKSSSGEIPKYFQQQKLNYVLTISEDGEIIGIEPTENNKPYWVPALVGLVRTSGVIPQFLWDSPSYFFGYIRVTKKLSKKEIIRNRKRAREKFDAAFSGYKELLEGIPSQNARAILNFYRRMSSHMLAQDDDDLSSDDLDSLSLSSEYAALLREGKITALTFRIDQQLAIKDPQLQAIWQDKWSLWQKPYMPSPRKLPSIVDGQIIDVARTHNQIQVQGGQGAGVAFVSFNDDSVKSYNLGQSENAPMSEDQQFSYVQALRYMLNNDEYHIVKGKVTILGWAKTRERRSTSLPILDFKRSTPTQKDVYTWLKMFSSLQGVRINGVEWRKSDPCYFLGITPNNARVAVRFFYINTFGQFLSHIYQFYDDLDIVGKPDGWTPNPYELAKATQPLTNKPGNSLKKDEEKLSKEAERIYSQVYLAALKGTAFPYSLLYAVEARIRAAMEQTSKKDKTTAKKGRRKQKSTSSSTEKFDWLKAAIIRAFYLRRMPSGYTKEDFTVALNENNNRVPYILGRLFYVLQWVQEVAEKESPSYTSSIQRGFFSTASTSPRAVFPQILKLVQSYQIKLHSIDPNKSVYLEKMISDLMGRLPDDFPAHLTIVEQGQFFLGYYQQRLARYTSKKNDLQDDNKKNAVSPDKEFSING